MKVFESFFPQEVVNRITLYHATPTADAMRQVIQAYNEISNKCDMDLTFYNLWLKIISDPGKTDWLETKAELLFIANLERRRDRAFEIQLAIRTRLGGHYTETYDEWCDRWDMEQDTYEQYKERVFYTNC
jgi:hypothetical protein